MDLASIGKEPVRADMPSGSDVRYDPTFEELQAEMEKLSSPLVSGSIDWAKVEKLASDILSWKSKDLLVASYLAVSLIYTRKLEGLAVGLQIYRDLLEWYWDTLYPPKARMRGRIGAIVWWLEKSAAALAQLPPSSCPGEKMAPVREILGKIEELFRRYLDEPPALRPLVAVIGSLEAPRQEAPKTDAPPQVAPASSMPGTTHPEPGSAREPVRSEAPLEVASPEDARKAMSQAFRKVLDAASYLRKNDLANPLPYRITRLAAWSQVIAAPPATDGRTAIPPPAGHIKAPLDALRGKGNDEALLHAVETTLPQLIFWMDLNRWAAEALSRLGEKYRNALEAVRQETAFLSNRFPSLAELSFNDGTPFADTETRQWLGTIAIGGEVPEREAPSPAEHGPADPDREEIAAEVEKAKALFREGKLAEAVEPIQKRIRTGFSRKDALRWRMALSGLLLGAGHARLALPHLEQILRDIDDFRLEEYDPLFALEGLKLAWRGFDSQADKSSKERAAQALLRIGKIDLTEVLRMGKGK